MPRKTTPSQKTVKTAMRKFKRGTLKSGRAKKKATNRKQAIAIGLSEARRKGQRVPPRTSRSSRRKATAPKRRTTQRTRAKSR